MSSETVQAAQRLLAEREAVGLRKYGTTVDRTDLAAGDWLQHAIEEASDLLLYLIRLRETAQGEQHWRREAKERQINTSQEIQDALDRIPVYASAPAAAPEDADGDGISKPARDAYARRAAYEARWQDAPEWARWLSQDREGNCDWWQDCPQVLEGAWLWCGLGKSDNAPDRLLCSFGAEPRPTPEDGQGVEG